MSLLRSDGSRDDQVGEAGPVEAVDQQRPRVSKLGLEGLPYYYSNEIALEAARQGTRGLS